MTVESRGWNQVPADFEAWQLGVMRFLDRLERMPSRLPVPVTPEQRLPALPVPREPSMGYRKREVDFLETRSRVYITLEMLGVEKEDIDLTVTEETLTVRVEGEGWKYFREMSLPPHLDLETVEASYRNGVLDIVIERLKGR
jgi:HSP20 family molecular chaperone IbpA